MTIEDTISKEKLLHYLMMVNYGVVDLAIIIPNDV